MMRSLSLISNTTATLTSEYEFVDVCLKLADEISRRSKDPRTKVGSVVFNPYSKKIISLGYNGFPSAVKDFKEVWENTDDFNKITKYDFVIHAEMNAILNAKETVDGCAIFCTHKPCPICTKHIIATGITKLVWRKDGVPKSYCQRDHDIFDALITHSCVQTQEI
jgi:dCMP deaminase